MKTLLIKTTLLLFAITFLYPQASFSTNFDSLQAEAAVYYQNRELEIARKMYQNLLEKAIVEKQEKWMIHSYMTLGLIEERDGNSEKGIEIVIKALNLAIEYNSNPDIAQMNYYLSKLYSNTNDNFQALEYAKNGEKYATNIPLYYTLRNIGTRYYNLYYPDSALSYFNKAKYLKDSLLKAGNNFPKNQFLDNNFGNVYLMKQEPVKALSFFRKELDREENFSVLCNMGICFLSLNKLDSAYIMFNKYFKHVHANNIEDDIPFSYSYMSTYYSANKEYKKALNFARESMESAIEYKQPEVLSLAYLALAKAYNGLDKNDSAFYYFDKYEMQVAVTYRDDMMGVYNSITEINKALRSQEKRQIVKNEDDKSTGIWIAIIICISAIVASVLITMLYLNHKKKYYTQK
jgi:tetratricopeptide (TPR) repeat protein